ncbi:MAG: hypothetical protein L0Y44_12985 [Phycisphaerales bacterium]|nr:hypothetical protein [Phycisphaerales bacterium]MCI0631558.1 hypothetical protein [Phycisphaerales bacterium]MCI0676818.1 hypothetical protein [Phycisphaerales bacterium]
MTSNVPTFETLVAYAAGELTASEVREVESQIRVLPSAAAKLAQIRDVLDGLRRQTISAPQSRVVDQVIAAFRRRERVAPAAWLQRTFGVIADLVLDSSAGVALAGFRGGTQARQLSYHAAGAVLDLQIAPTADPEQALFEITGQLERDSSDEPSAALLLAAGAETIVDQASLDSDGLFELHAVAGLYDLVVGTGPDSVIVPKLQVG